MTGRTDPLHPPPEVTGSAANTQRGVLLRRGLTLVRVSIGWMLVEAAVSAWAGIAAGSTLLVAFAADSGIELLSALVLHWRLGRELHDDGTDATKVERAERQASRIAGILLYALALYVLAEAAHGLWRHHGAEVSWPGVGIGLVAALGMPILARAKLSVAEALGSRALRADAMESITCGYLSWVLLIGLIANALLGWWWLDAAVSLGVVPLLFREAREAFRNECCGCTASAP